MKQKLLNLIITFFFPFYLIGGEKETNTKKITLYDREGIVEISKRYIGFPYKSGGNTPEGFDCSGFTQYVYKKAGYSLPRTTVDQYNLLEPVKIPKKGDLVFFSIYNNKVSHVGIYIGDFQFIHSPRTGKKVEIADLRNSYWKKHYIGARKFFVD